MSLALVILTLGAALGVAARADSVGLGHAVARRGCTQEDAPALELYLSRASYDGSPTAEPTEPYLRVEVAWGAWTRPGGESLRLVPLDRRAERQAPVVRAEWHAGRAAPVWLHGTLRLRRVEVGRRVVGSYAFEGPAGDRLSGRFTAAWVEARGGCG